MKKLTYLALISILVSSSALTFSGDKNVKAPEVKEYKYGMYMQAFKKMNMTYIVDPIAQLCTSYFYANVSVSGIGVGTHSINCANLAKRDEWKPIITWVKDEEAK